MLEKMNENKEKNYSLKGKLEIFILFVLLLRVSENNSAFIQVTIYCFYLKIKCLINFHVYSIF